jgi:hypothetical protein
MIPSETTIAVVEAELPAMLAYAQRHGWTVTWSSTDLSVLLDGAHPDGSPIRWHADVAGYRAVPPAWTVAPTASGAAVRFPTGDALPGGKPSIFHSHKKICAPFNRLAYTQHGGMHGDWGEAVQWLSVKGHVEAKSLAEMLAQIDIHLGYSKGWC